MCYTELMIKRFAVVVFIFTALVLMGNYLFNTIRVNAAAPECSDGVDNDGDGKTDYPADPDCPSAAGLNEQALVIGPSKPSITFSANPLIINKGFSSTLTWSSPSAEVCKKPGDWFYPVYVPFFGYVGGDNKSGSMSVSPSSDTKYSVTCKDSTNERTDELTVYVVRCASGSSCHGETLDTKVIKLTITDAVSGVKRDIVSSPNDGPLNITANPDDQIYVNVRHSLSTSDSGWDDLNIVSENHPDPSDCISSAYGKLPVSFWNFGSPYNEYAETLTYNKVRFLDEKDGVADNKSRVDIRCSYYDWKGAVTDMISDSVDMNFFASGPGPLPTHLDCVSNVCSRVVGLGPDSCAPEGSACGVLPPPPPPPPPPLQHLECKSNVCSLVPGAGVNKCAPKGVACGIPPKPVSVNININGIPGSSPIINGNAGTINWTSTNATACTASDSWSGAKGTSGSESTGILTFSKNYVITCTGPSGSAEDSVTAAVTYPGGGPFVDIRAQ